MMTPRFPLSRQSGTRATVPEDQNLITRIGSNLRPNRLEREKSLKTGLLFMSYHVLRNADFSDGPQLKRASFAHIWAHA
jgi:hypothetical protein